MATVVTVKRTFTRTLKVAAWPRSVRTPSATSMARSAAPHLVRQLGEQLLEIVGAFHACMVFRCQHIIGFFDRHIRQQRLRTAEIVDQLVACDRVHPWRE